MRRAVILLVATATAVFVAGALVPPGPSAQTTSTGTNGKIVYVKRDTAPGEHLYDIWVMDADGSNETNLTNTPDVSENQPAFSFDGAKIAFNGPGDENEDGDILSDIWVMDTDPSTDDATNLTNTPDFHEFQPAWAPSGTQLAFMRDVPGQSISEQSDVFVMDANGENATNLTKSDASELSPDWSPDGTKIVFAGVRNRGWEILTMDPDGQNEIILTGDSFEGDDHEPDWSPDSTKVVFMKQSMVGGCCEPWEIWAVNRDGSGDTNLTNHPRDDTFPAWSPDGSEITFSSNRNADASGQSDIYAMPAPTTLPPGESASNATSEDSSMVALAAGHVLREANAQTTSETAVRRLTRGGSSTAPDWGSNSAPTVTSLRPADGSTTAELRPIIGAKVTDAQTNLTKKNVTLWFDGTTIERTLFSYNRDTDRLRYTPGTDLSSTEEHTVKVVARDPEGLVTRKLWSFSVGAP